MRIRMVTRTVKETTINVMTVDTTTATIKYKDVTVIGEYPEKTLEKLVRSAVEKEDGIKFVSMGAMHTNEKIYGMTEEEFVALAKPIER